MELPTGAVCLIIICLAGQALGACDTSGVLQCENLDLLNERLLPQRHTISAICPLLPPLFTCVERYLSTCDLSRNVFWMVRREVFSYICQKGARGYMASVDCFERNNANKVVTVCETQLQKNLVKHNACQVVDEFVACAESELGSQCGDIAGCVMGNVGRAYVGVIKDLLKCPDKDPVTYCEAPELPTTMPSPTTTETTTARHNVTTTVMTPSTAPEASESRQTTTPKDDVSTKPPPASASPTADITVGMGVDATRTSELLDSASSVSRHRPGVVLGLAAAAAAMTLRPLCWM